MDSTGRLIEGVEKETLSQTPPSKVIAAIPFGKELLDRMEGAANYLDSGFAGWEPPYAPIVEEVQYDSDEQMEVDKAIGVKRDEYYHLVAEITEGLATENRLKLEESIIEMPGTADGLLKAASIRCRENGDYPGALSSWFKWFTHRSQGDGWGLNPDAWVLLTEIYIGLQDIPKAKQMLVFAFTMVATELEQSTPNIRGYLLSNRSEQLGQLCRKLRILVSNGMVK